jgi:hypothetical protein
MGVVSGIGGVVDSVPCVRNWSINSTADLQAGVCSASQGGTFRVAGNKDWTGSYDAYGHTPAAMPGEAFSFTGSIDGSLGASGTAIVDQVVITIDIEAGAIISHVVNFSANGALTFGAAVATDATAASPISAIGCLVKVSDVTETDVRTVTVTITAANTAYVSSDTAGQVQRKAGNIDANVSFTIYNDNMINPPQPNTTATLKVYVTATTFWEFDWVMFGDLTGITVDREGAAILGATVNAFMCGYSGGAAGYIKKPDTTTFWPAA